ncbi:MAG: bacteriohemerythrin [Clostridiaceae bacterium BRH_c20a]|nr:MAG: bacteriohemerythrin [Clostridiaceae bacterium BRH_c20a]
MIKWKDDYKIGVPQIDEQHEKLFEICDRAYALLKNKIYLDKYDRIIQILDELKDYTIYHFKFEEEYMQKIGYKKLLSQKVSHNDFIEKINNIDLKIVDEKQDIAIMEVLDFVLKWIEYHILNEDKKISTI